MNSQVERGIDQDTLGVDPTSFENVCTCKACNHDLARDCFKVKCRCCTIENHTMIMDGIEGFVPTDRE